jgi:hypothetical protein
LYRFLLATLQTTYVLETLDAKERRNRLNSLPATPENAYREILEDRLTAAERAFAKQILSWVFYARTPLEMAKLQEALAIIPGEVKFDRSNISAVEDIVRTCGSLVNHDKSTDTVSFSHALVKKFLEDHQSEYMVKESDIALTCLTSMTAHLHKDSWSSQQKIPLSHYAQVFWSAHVKNTQGDRNLQVEMGVFEAFGYPLEVLPEAQLQATLRVPAGYHSHFVTAVVDKGIGFILTNPLTDDRILAG